MNESQHARQLALIEPDYPDGVSTMILGALVGLAIGYLYFTEHGRQARTKLERMLDRLADDLERVRTTAHSVAARSLDELDAVVGSSRVDLQACKLEYSIVSPK